MVSLTNPLRDQRINSPPFLGNMASRDAASDTCQALGGGTLGDPRAVPQFGRPRAGAAPQSIAAAAAAGAMPHLSGGAGAMPHLSGGGMPHLSEDGMPHLSGGGAAMPHLSGGGASARLTAAEAGTYTRPLFGST